MLVVSLVCYLATFVFSGFLFHWFTPSGHDCGLNTFFIIMTLIFVFVFAIVVLHPTVSFDWNLIFLLSEILFDSQFQAHWSQINLFFCRSVEAFYQHRLYLCTACTSVTVDLQVNPGITSAMVSTITLKLFQQAQWPLAYSQLFSRLFILLFVLVLPLLFSPLLILLAQVCFWQKKPSPILCLLILQDKDSFGNSNQTWTETYILNPYIETLLCECLRVASKYHNVFPFNENFQRSLCFR